MTTDLDAKRKRTEMIVKVLGLGVVGFLVAPFIFATIQGLIGLVIAAAISFGVISFIPYFALKVANWRLKALKAEASKNPVETLQNEYNKKQIALNQFKANIKIFAGQVLTFADQVKQYVRDGLEDAQDYVEQLNKMKQLLSMREQKYKDAEAMLADFADTIQKTDRKWKMACAAAKMNEAAGELEGDVFDKICTETALDSVQTKLNQSFADLEVALLDDPKQKKQVADKALVIDNGPSVSSRPRQQISVN